MWICYVFVTGLCVLLKYIFDLIWTRALTNVKLNSWISYKLETLKNVRLQILRKILSRIQKVSLRYIIALITWKDTDTKNYLKTYEN